MFYRILRRILRRHALFHLLIPLVVGVVVEVIYSVIVDQVNWSALPTHLLSGHRIALYIGIFLAYVFVIGILIKWETNIGLRQLDLNALARKLKNAQSLFAVGTLRFDEWFDPAVQVYLATILKEKINNTSFRYERVLLLGSRSAKKDLGSDYLDGYHARCLIRTHDRLGVSLYFIEWPQILTILGQLTLEEKIHVGFYPEVTRHVPKNFANWFTPKISRSRVRKAAVGVIETGSGSTSAFRFAKHDKIVNVQFEPEAREAACVKFVELIKKEIYQQGTTTVQPKYDFAIGVRPLYFSSLYFSSRGF